MNRPEMRRTWRADNKILQSRGLKPVSFQDWFELKLAADHLQTEANS